jgi:hypothetical protein
MRTKHVVIGVSDFRSWAAEMRADAKKRGPKPPQTAYQAAGGEKADNFASNPSNEDRIYETNRILKPSVFHFQSHRTMVITTLFAHVVRS